VKCLLAQFLFGQRNLINLKRRCHSATCCHRPGFLNFLFFSAQGDPIFRQQLKDMPNNALMTSKTVQNDLIDATAQFIRDKIVAEVKRYLRYLTLFSSANFFKSCSVVNKGLKPTTGMI